MAFDHVQFTSQPSLLHLTMAKRKSAALNSYIKQHEKPQNGSIHVCAVELDECTDLRRWRLADDRGRQTWHYMSTDEGAKSWPQNTIDKYHLGLEVVRTIASDRVALDADRARDRICQACHELLHLWHLPSMPYPFSPTCSCHQETGLANMVGQCFSFRD